MKACGLWLACALAVLLASAATARDETPPDRTAVLTGMTALAEQTGDNGTQRNETPR